MASTKRGLPFVGKSLVCIKQAAAANAITALSNTDPAIANALAHGLKTGDAIWLESKSNEAINGYYLIEVSNEDTFAVIGLDGTDIGTVTDAKFTAPECYQFCDVNSLKVDAVKTKEDDATTICDEDPYTEVTIEAGSLSMSGLWQPDKEVQGILYKMAKAGETIFFIYKPKHSKVMFGYQLKITSMSNDGKSRENWTFSLDGKINGTIRIVKVDTDKQPTTKRGAK